MPYTDFSMKNGNLIFRAKFDPIFPTILILNVLSGVFVHTRSYPLDRTASLSL